MIMQETIQVLQRAPLQERIAVIELLLQSLKDEIAQSQASQVSNKPFRVRTFNLGSDIDLDREAMYADRVS